MDHILKLPGVVNPGGFYKRQLLEACDQIRFLAKNEKKARLCFQCKQLQREGNLRLAKK